MIGRGVGPFRIRKVGTDQWLRSEIDSSGMSVIWSSREHSAEFAKWSKARAMLARVSERYPREYLEIVPEYIIHD